MKKISGLLLVGCSALALAGCGADDISAPGADSITVNNGSSTPTQSPTPTPTSTTVVAATSCPSTGGVTLTNDGVVTSPEGTWRVCTLPALINKSSALPKVAGVLYRLHGRVDVGCDGGFSAPTSGSPYTTTTQSCLDAGIGTAAAQLTSDTNVTLTVDPGVIVYGENGSGPAWLAVNRGNKISATGTAEKPIIFTSVENVTHQNGFGDTAQGQWGGVVLLGRGLVTDCDNGIATNNVGSAHTCERETEGSANPATFGGNDNSYNAGTMKYVQIRYSGYSLSPNKELQSLTGGGVGTGTTLEYFQSVNSSDDGSEWFGGAVNFKHYIAVNADDDSLDMDTGLKGNFQYLLLLQRANGGDAFFEDDSDGNETDKPRQNTTVANFTAVQSGNHDGHSDKASIMVRGNTNINFVNGIVYTPSDECINLSNNAATKSDGPTFTANSVVMTCGSTGPFLGTGKATTAEAKAMFDAGTNNNSAFTSTLASTFVNGSNESGVTSYSNITSLSSYFDNVAYIGAVNGTSDTWYKGWTCDNSTANFGSGQACTALPTT